MAEEKKKKRVGIVGFGNLGQYLYEAVKAHEDYEIAFVWNRTLDNLKGKIPANFVLEDLGQFASRNPDVIAEVAHPSISAQYGPLFLEKADYMVGSPTALAEQHVEDRLRQAASHHGLYIPAGALWGGGDIQKMADRGTLKGLKITMTKHPDHFRLASPLKEKNASVTDKAITLYDGPVRGLCPLAPHNVNTMAAGAIAAHNLGFDKVKGCLVSDPSLTEWHHVEVEVIGPGDHEAGKAFSVNTLRKNPAKPGAVTGSATSVSFLSSLLRAHDMGPGVHLC
ncbi:putative L-aspartate dehydrogenase-like [Apostichopus japonicus]|uniref:Aspartate dehydrogenase domain-containing protein n=1 Tax=Stichopus japonicus TaxID=307972 RepID=A0A2G8LRR4_STIJA|nr:putative L-aspartate dehydrogenase-like [Apostichopus japonicus]